MKTPALFFAAGLTASLAATSAASAGVPTRSFLAEHQWQSRLLVINAESFDNQLIGRQKALLARTLLVSLGLGPQQREDVYGG